MPPRAPSRALWLVTWLVSTTPSRAAYESDCGFSRLADILGPAMPTGSGISVATIESGPAYLPQSGSATFPGSGNFTGRSFTAKSGTSPLSLHAERVGYHLYGPYTSSASGWATMAPDITAIDCYEANSWTDNAFLRPGLTNTAPLTELRSIQNHSWIEYASSATAATYNDFLRRLDFAIHRDGFLCTTAVNNTAGNATPELMASAFNSLSIGLSNGNHSTGPTSSLVDSPGRLKPEIVAPFDATSWATPYVASAAAILRQRANASAIPIDQSTSSLYNLEHVWKKNLPAARYRLRISRTPGTSSNCAIAWRLHSAPLLPTLTPSVSGNSVTLTASSLVEGQSCRIDTSTDLLSWSPVHSFIAASSSASYSEPATPGTRYYRLALLPR